VILVPPGVLAHDAFDCGTVEDALEYSSVEQAFLDKLAQAAAKPAAVVRRR
jgi:hypothetical protein